MKKWFKILSAVFSVSLAALSLAGCAPSEIKVGSVLESDPPLPQTDIRYTADTLPSLYTGYDFDGDKLKNKDEIEYGTDMYNGDTDGDGIDDGSEIAQTKTDPVKYSTRDDGISDMEWWFSQSENFTEGWSATDASGFKVYLAEPSDRMFAVSKTSTDKFDDMETVTEAYRITGFSGKMSLNCSAYNEEVYNNIDVYALRNGEVINLNAVPDENGLVIFEIMENDVFAGVYSGE